MRIDARFLIGPSPVRAEITGSPSRVVGTPAGFIESGTYPSLVFSNNDATGRTSTLSSTYVIGFEVFSGGWQLRPRVTVGVFWRFGTARPNVRRRAEAWCLGVPGELAGVSPPDAV